MPAYTRHNFQDEQVGVSDTIIDAILMYGQAPLVAGKLRTIETLLSVHQPALKEAYELVQDCLRIVENRL